MIDVKPLPPEEVRDELSSLPDPIQSVLYHRGIETAEAAEKYLDPSVEDLHDPFLMAHMRSVVDRLREAAAHGQSVVIMGDFDTDGMTAAAVMAVVCDELGILDVDTIIPDFFASGVRGFSPDALEAAKKKNPDLLIVVDFGMGNPEEISTAIEAGMDVIVIDHHKEVEELHEAVLLLNPHVDGAYPFESLCACGIAFKVSQAALGRVDPFMLSLAAMATIADKVPLIDENRYISRMGLEALRLIESPGMRVLGKRCRYQLQAMADRINSAIPQGGVTNAYRLLRATNAEDAERIYEELNERYREDQSRIKKNMAIAIQHAQEQVNKAIVVLRDEEFDHHDISWLSTALVSRLKKPVFVCSEEDGIMHASSRSNGEVDLVELMRGFERYLMDYGGHPRAAGCVFRSEHFDDIVAAIDKVGVRSRVVDYRADATVTDVSNSIMDYLDKLKPYGMGNPMPILVLSATKEHAEE